MKPSAKMKVGVFLNTYCRNETKCSKKHLVPKLNQVLKNTLDAKKTPSTRNGT